MPLVRILLFALLIWILYRLVKRIIGPPKGERSKQVEYEDMVRCAWCGTHFPRSNALTRSGKDYCCEQHAQADSKPGE